MEHLWRTYHRIGLDSTSKTVYNPATMMLGIPTPESLEADVAFTVAETARQEALVEELRQQWVQNAVLHAEQERRTCELLQWVRVASNYVNYGLMDWGEAAQGDDDDDEWWDE